MGPISANLSARPVVLGLTGVCAVLALITGYLFASAVDTSPILPGVQLPGEKGLSSADLTTPLDSKPIGEFRETVRRPLFNAHRKPVDRPRTAKAEAGGASGSALDMRLVGIVKSGNAPARALIRQAGERNGKWITEGETFAGWKLRSVKDRSVIVEGEGRQHELALQVVVRRSEDDATDSAANPR